MCKNQIITSELKKQWIKLEFIYYGNEMLILTLQTELIKKCKCQSYLRKSLNTQIILFEKQ